MVRGKRDTVYEKGYWVQCVKDNYEFELLETDISRNYGCPVCTNHKVIKGINDVATTHPEIAELFENIEDAYTTSYSTSKKFRFKCPRCKHVKLDSTNHINYFGFSCPCCSDGISYPNKFVAKLLMSLDVNFDREIQFEWCKYPCFVDSQKFDYGSYDFVLPDNNIIIEVDGELGHGRNIISTIQHNRRKLTVEETIYRDKMKDKLAVENGYKIIRIDCVYKDIRDRFENITSNIKNSELSHLFELENIDFQLIDEFCSTNSYLIDSTKLWNTGLRVVDISKQMKLSTSTISKYLSMGSKLNLCNYNNQESCKRGYTYTKRRAPYAIYYDNKIEVFSSFKEMVDYYKRNYNINICRQTLDRYIKSNKLLYDRKFVKITKEEFNKFYNNKSLANLVVGKAFSIEKN